MIAHRMLSILLTLSCAALLSGTITAQANSRLALETDVASGWGNGAVWLKSLERGFKDYGVQIVSKSGGHPVRLGSKSIRFEVRPGDCGSNADHNDCETDRERHELSQNRNLQKPGREYWFSWSIFIPEETALIYPTPVHLGQFYPKKAGSNRTGDRLKPSVLFSWLSVGYMVDNQAPGDGQTKDLVPIVNDHDVRGKWQDVLVHSNFSTGSDGFFRVYVNHIPVYSFTGQMVPRGTEIYFKFGIYRSFLSRFLDAKNVKEAPEQVIYYDEINRGGRLKDVDTVGLIKIQEMAQAKGYYNGSIDGQWGPNTLKGVNMLLADRGAEPVSSYSMKIWETLTAPDIGPLPQPEYIGGLFKLRKDLAAGEVEFVKEWQNFLYSRGLYRGAVDGVYTTGMRDALAKCIVDKVCRITK